MVRKNNEPRERFGQYEVLCVINEPSPRNPKAVPVFIMASVDSDVPMKYQVRRNSSAVQFETYREVAQYCRGRGYVR